MKVKGLKWTKIKLEDWNKIYINLEGQFCILPFLLCTILYFFFLIYFISFDDVLGKIYSIIIVFRIIIDIILLFILTTGYFNIFKIFFVKIFVIINLLSTILLGKLKREMFDRNDRYDSLKVQWLLLSRFHTVTSLILQCDKH